MHSASSKEGLLLDSANDWTAAGASSTTVPHSATRRRPGSQPASASCRSVDPPANSRTPHKRCGATESWGRVHSVDGSGADADGKKWKKTRRTIFCVKQQTCRPPRSCIISGIHPFARERGPPHRHRRSPPARSRPYHLARRYSSWHVTCPVASGACLVSA